MAELKGDRKPSIKLISPQGGEVWTEGETYEIQWESRGVKEVYISIAVGGKERGLLKEGNRIDARWGKIYWKIPHGFVTGFGISKSEQVRIMIFDARNSAIHDISRPFTIEGTRSGNTMTSARKAKDDYAEAIYRYYEAIAQKRYREAYEMLVQCKIVLYDADGSAVAFLPRDDYETWLKTQKNIEKLTLIDVKGWYPGSTYTADRGNAMAIMGIRTYEVILDIQLREEKWAIRSGRHSFIVSVVKGIDGKVRIIGIGTGP